MHDLNRTRWAAIGAAVAIALGAGGLATVDAAISSGQRAVFVPITPCRLVDTRSTSTVGPRNQPLGAAETHVVDAHGDRGDCSIPSDAVGLSLNVTAVDASAPTFLTVWPDGADRPEASSLNPQPGQPPTPNAVSTELSGAGRFAVFNRQGVVDVIVDVNGYYSDHDHDDRYYTKAEVDSLVAAPRSPVTMSQGIDWAPNGGNPATVEVFEGSVQVTGPPGGGTAQLSIVGPESIAGDDYELTSVRYCALIDDPALVVEASIIGVGTGIAGDPLGLSAETKDPTDRTEPGCYEISASAEVASRRTHHLMLVTEGDVFIGEVAATWTAA
jgi:hypothetical protein